MSPPTSRSIGYAQSPANLSQLDTMDMRLC